MFGASTMLAGLASAAFVLASAAPAIVRHQVGSAEALPRSDRLAAPKIATREPVASMEIRSLSGGQIILRARDGRLLYMSDPTTGGVTASFAMLGDIQIAEPGALIGFAGPRVIRETIGRDLPPGFQTSEFLQEKGFVDMIMPRHQMRDTLALLLDHLTGDEAPEADEPADSREAANGEATAAARATRPSS